MSDIESMKGRLAREADTLDKIGDNVDVTARMLGCAVDEAPGKLGDSMRDALTTITSLQSKLAEATTFIRNLECECDSYHGYECTRCTTLATIREEEQCPHG